MKYLATLHGTPDGDYWFDEHFIVESNDSVAFLVSVFQLQSCDLYDDSNNRLTIAEAAAMIMKGEAISTDNGEGISYDHLTFREMTDDEATIIRRLAIA